MEEVQQTKELVVTHKISLKSNMEELKASIAEQIKKYDVVVTEDRIGEAKDLMAQFNKDKKAFSDKCKEFLGEVSKPIDAFKAEQKEIERMYDDGRQKIADQVAKFEAKKLNIIEGLLETHKDLQCEERGIDPKSVTITDLIKLTAVNVSKNGYTVAKATADIIEQRIQAVENQILRAKLEEQEKAKERERIAEEARKAAEEKAEREKQELIAKAERDKIEAAQKAEREKAEAVEKAKQEALQNAPQSTNEVKEVVRDTPAPQSENKPTEDGKKVYNISFTFEIKTNAKAPIDKVIEAVKNMMLNDTGKEKLKEVNVR